MKRRYKKTKLVQSVGINDADYVVGGWETVHLNGVPYKKKWVCPFYDRWIKMLWRCYSEPSSKIGNYGNCSVHKDWLTFSNFKAWMESQKWEGLELDKDILSSPDNLIYSSNTCCFVPAYVNISVITSPKYRQLYPLGVCKWVGKFKAQSKDSEGGKLYLGVFTTPEKAHKAWQESKVIRIQETIDRYSTEECFLESVYESLNSKLNKLKQEVINGLETIHV